jgi:23S rRNA pseudouridine1911/1915/1917 synthase
MIQNRGFEYGVIHLRNEMAGPLTESLATQLNLSSTEIQRLLNFGAIYLENKRITQNTDLKLNDYLRIHTRPRSFNRKVIWSEQIFWQNEDFIVVDKPSGIPCHSTVDNLYENVQAQLEATLARPIFLTHRLDVPTSGLLVYGKTTKTQSDFNRALNQSEVSKIYEAIVELPAEFPSKLPAEQATDSAYEKILPPLGTQVHYMEPSPRAPKKVHNHQAPGYLRCELIILDAEKIGNQAHVKIELKTGRTHQIRTQLSHLGFPIVGDTQYGAQALTPAKPWDEIKLRATQIKWGNYLWSTEFK